MTEERDDGDIGLDKMEIRHLLLLAGDEPLHAAVALGRGGKAVIALDRRKPPRTLQRELQEALPDGREFRFGTFTRDAADPRLGRFVVNRAAPGMARKLVMALKGTGMRRVEVGPEGGSDIEGAQDDDEDGVVQDYAPAAPLDAAEQRAEQEAEHAALTHILAGLVRRIIDTPGDDPTRRAQLAALAETAQAHLKQDDHAGAARAMRALRDALEG